MLHYKKVVFTKPWEVELQKDNIDDKNIPSGNVMLKKIYSLISTGTELACLSGGESWFPLPGVMGYCCIGEIVAKASDVVDYDIGDKIFCYGSHTEYEIIPTTGIFLKVPEGIDSKYIPFVRMATIAATSVRTSNIEFGDYVLVTGQGLVGNMAAQLAKIQGGIVIAVDICQNRLDISKGCGIDYTLNSKECDIKEEIKKITGGKMVSTCIEATGLPSVEAANLELIAQNGEIIFLGSPRANYSVNLTDVLNHCHLAAFNVTFKGAHEWKFPVNEDSFVKHSLERNSKIMFEFFKTGRICLEGLVTEVVKPESCKAAYDSLRNKKDDYMGIIFDWQ
ncbi:MAG TPA: zinc-binding alcohol dehydrogenase [Ruminiclostridium sp.]